MAIDAVQVAKTLAKTLAERRAAGRPGVILRMYIGMQVSFRTDKTMQHDAAKTRDMNVRERCCWPAGMDVRTVVANGAETERLMEQVAADCSSALQSIIHAVAMSLTS